MPTAEPHPALAHRCPFCHADPGEACRTPSNVAIKRHAHAKRVAIVDDWVQRRTARPSEQALCCRCGNLRIYKRARNYIAERSITETWHRMTGDLKCNNCGTVTRHALLRSGKYRDVAENYQRTALGGEPTSRLEDVERAQKEYRQGLPRNPYLRHRYWTKEAEQAWDDGSKSVIALCGEPMAVKTDPRRATKDKKDESPGRLVADQLSDTEYEDPETGMWWIDMACVDCCRVSNAHHWKARRTRLEWFLANFAVHPEWVEDHEVDGLLGKLEAMLERAKSKDGGRAE